MERKALHIALKGDPSNNGITPALQANGWNTLELDWRAIQNRRGHAGLQRAVLDAARAHQPGLVFCQLQTPGILENATVLAMREAGAFVVNWTGDAREDIGWYLAAGDAFSTTLFTNEADPERMRAAGKPAGFLRMGYDPHFWTPEGPGHGPSPFVPEVIFLANNYGTRFPKSAEREELVRFLAAKLGSKRFRVFGSGWASAAGRCNGGPLSPQASAAALRSGRLVIAQSQFELERYTSDRLPIAMAMGRLVLAQRYPGMAKDFEPGRHLLSWMGPEDLLADIDRALTYPESSAAIAKAGREHVARHFAWPQVMRQLAADHLPEHIRNPHNPTA